MSDQKYQITGSVYVCSIQCSKHTAREVMCYVFNFLNSTEIYMKTVSVYAKYILKTEDHTQS
jgi:hypothetical protein